MQAKTILLLFLIVISLLPFGFGTGLRVQRNGKPTHIRVALTVAKMP
jgi:ABC-type transport system involved in cytochrome c biogenesis permease component